MARKLSGIQFDSSLAGLANYSTATFFYNINAHVLGAGQVSRWLTTWKLNNTNAISAIQINYAGLETVYRPISGASALNFAGGTYQLQTVTYYRDGNSYVDTYVINQTGGNVNIPAIAVNVRIFLYNAPF